MLPLFVHRPFTVCFSKILIIQAIIVFRTTNKLKNDCDDERRILSCIDDDIISHNILFSVLEFPMCTKVRRRYIWYIYFYWWPFQNLLFYPFRFLKSHSGDRRSAICFSRDAAVNVVGSRERNDSPSHSGCVCQRHGWATIAQPIQYSILFLKYASSRWTLV